MPTDWIMGLAGGFLIGTAGAVFLLLNGRIMGASGLLGGLIDGSGRHNFGERLAFVIGVIGLPAIAVTFLSANPTTNATSNAALLIIGGLLVGYGTRTANGCTSGHGVCGISRFSLRGIVATLIYIGAGGLTMVIGRHLLGLI